MNNSRSRFVVLSVLSLVGVACQTTSTSTSARPKVLAIDDARMDKSVAPCADFWRFTMGSWLKTVTIPNEYPSTGVDREVNERNEALLHELLDDAAKAHAPKGSIEQKVGDFYASGMDEAAIEKAGIDPLKPDLARIDALSSNAALAPLLGAMSLEGVGAGFRFDIGQDDKRSTIMIVQLSQGGLGLPDRDYYTKPDRADVRAKYVAHLERMFQLLGESSSDASRDAATVMDLETDLAKASMTIVERRDPQKTYNRLTTDEFIASSPGFDWHAYFGAVGCSSSELLVRQPEFFKAFANVAGSRPLADWKAYLRMHLVRRAAPFLSKAFVDEDFAFSGKTLRGTTEQLPRWKRVMAMTDRELGEALGQLYVARAFTPEAKAKMLELVGNLKIALAHRIEKLEWMSAATKKAALHKLDSIVVKIGYPDRWRDYSAFDVQPGAFLTNVRAGAVFEFKRELAKLGKPVDRTEWGMTPATNNAYYEPTLNEVCFPAGILQPPYFDVNADDAVNYGEIGATIGHEITHGFDDEGRQYDAEGNLKDWWTPEDSKAYDDRAKLVVAQYNAFEPLPGQHINGEATLGENIADIGGLLIAYDALQIALQGKSRAPIDGYTPEQRFFLAYAESWRTAFRKEDLSTRLNVDVHSPAEQRVMGPVADLLEFYAAFGCKDGDAMKRADSVRPAIW